MNTYSVIFKLNFNFYVFKCIKQIKQILRRLNEIKIRILFYLLTFIMCELNLKNE